MQGCVLAFAPLTAFSSGAETYFESAGAYSPYAPRLHTPLLLELLNFFEFAFLANFNN